MILPSSSESETALDHGNGFKKNLIQQTDERKRKALESYQ